jgi:hypothetical protein
MGYECRGCESRPLRVAQPIEHRTVSPMIVASEPVLGYALVDMVSMHDYN